MKKTQTIMTVLVLLGIIVSVAMQLWLPASLFTIAALLFTTAAILQVRTPNVSARKGGSANETGVGRSPEDIRRVREYREQHPGTTILEAVQAVEDQG